MENIQSLQVLASLQGGICLGYRRTLHDGAGNEVGSICIGIRLFE